MITIAIDCRKIHDGGIGTYLNNLLKYWSEKSQGAQFILFCYPKDRKSLGYFKDSAIIIDHDYGKYSIRELFSFRRPLLKYKVDLFFSPHYTLPFNLPCKSIAVVHDLIHLKFPVRSGIIGRMYAKTMMNHACKKAEFIITDSESSKGDLIHFFPRWFSKFKVIGCGVDHDIFKPLPDNVISQFRKEQSLPDKYIFYVGALRNHKNPKAILASGPAAAVRMRSSGFPGGNGLPWLSCGCSVGSSRAS
jgi:glycosyltransferase involved in cell wall biosynthesis